MAKHAGCGNIVRLRSKDRGYGGEFVCPIHGSVENSEVYDDVQI